MAETPMKITFLGTGTSMGVPTAGGFGREESTGDPRDERMRCSLWIKTPKTSIVIDTGPEFRLQTIKAGIRNIDLLLLTHEHMDHIGGLDDLRPFNYVQEMSIPVYTTESCVKAVKKRFDYMFGKDRYPGSVSVNLNVLQDTISHQDVTITPLPADHGNVEVMGFRVNEVSYLTDVKSVPEETLEKISGSKILVLNALRWEPQHPTHLTIPEARDLAAGLDVDQTYLIHMNSYVIHEDTNRRLPENVQLAYDFMELEL